MALKNILTAPAKLRSVLLKALRHSHIIAQLLSAKPRSISGACFLLLRRSQMLIDLSKDFRGCQCQKQHNGQKHFSHLVVLAQSRWSPYRRSARGSVRLVTQEPEPKRFYLETWRFVLGSPSPGLVFVEIDDTLSSSAIRTLHPSIASRYSCELH